jgi:hypothetical protein
MRCLPATRQLLATALYRYLEVSIGYAAHTARQISLGSIPNCSDSSTLLLPNSVIAISLQKEGDQSTPKDSVKRSRRSEIRI